MTNSRYEALVDIVTRANHAYSAGTPIMPDAEYDVLWQQLYEIDPSNDLLYFTSKDPSLQPSHHRHLRQYKSPLRAFNAEDLKPFLTRFGSQALILEPKYDGCAVVLSRQGDGVNSLRLTKAGDGIVGADVSHHLGPNLIIHTPGNAPLPKEASYELVIPLGFWNPNDGANPRNVVAGWLNRHTWPRDRYAHLVPHEGGGLFQNYKYTGDLEAFSATLLKLYYTWSGKYPIDGIMIKVADRNVRYATEEGLTHPWSIAWKPPIQTAETTVTEVEWNISRQGRLVPTVIYEPVTLCDTRNTRATGNNVEWLLDMGIAPGARIVLGKAGEIIPKILKVLKTATLGVPTTCPVCNEPLHHHQKHLVCYGEDCKPQKIRALTYLYSDKGMDLKGIGEAMIERLCEVPAIWEILQAKPHALLFPYTTGLAPLLIAELSPTGFSNYARSLAATAGTKSIADYFSGMGYPGLAYRTVVKLFHELITSVKAKHISGKARTSFARAIEECLPLVDIKPLDGEHTWAMLPLVAQKTCCITGTLGVGRNEAIALLESQGIQFTSTVTKNTSFLIQGEDAHETSKIRRARSLQVPIIPAAEFNL